MNYLVKECRPFNISELEMIESFKCNRLRATFYLKGDKEVQILFIGSSRPMNLSDFRVVYLDDLSDNPMIGVLSDRDIKVDSVLEF